MSCLNEGDFFGPKGKKAGRKGHNRLLRSVISVGGATVIAFGVGTVIGAGKFSPFSSFP